MRAPFPRPSLRLVGATGLALTLAFSAISRGQDPPSTPSSPARFIPKENLLLYVEYQGLDAQAEAWSKTAASKILNTTTTGVMLEDVANQLIEKLLTLTGQPAQPGRRMCQT